MFFLARICKCSPLGFISEPFNNPILLHVTSLVVILPVTVKLPGTVTLFPFFNSTLYNYISASCIC